MCDIHDQHKVDQHDYDRKDTLNQKYFTTQSLKTFLLIVLIRRTVLFIVHIIQVEYE